MSEKLRPDEDQQEARAAQAKQLAERISSVFKDRKPAVGVTVKGEAIDIDAGSAPIVVTANGDDTFSIKDDASHISGDAVIDVVQRKLR